MAYQGNYGETDLPPIVASGEEDPRFAAGLKHYEEVVKSKTTEIKEAELFLIGLSVQVADLEVRRQAAQNGVIEARKLLSEARGTAQTILDEADRIVAEKMAKVESELTLRETFLQEAEHAFSQKDVQLRDYERSLRKQEEDLDAQERAVDLQVSQLQDAQFRLESRMAAFDNRAKDLDPLFLELSTKQISIEAREKDLEESKTELHARIDLFKNETQALQIAQADYMVKSAALKDVLEERERLQKDKLEFGEVRDKLAAREYVLNEFEAQLRNQQNDLKQREKILVDKVKGAI